MNERKGVVTFKGGPLTLLGNEIKVGDKIPDVELVGNEMNPVKLSSFLGKTCIISAVPSLDTPVCDLETKRFNSEAANLAGVNVITVSMDLPFAQKRWCGAAGAQRVTLLSDYREALFGKNFGVLIKELWLLARVVFVVDDKGIVRYRQIVSDITKEPDYSSVLSALKSV